MKIERIEKWESWVKNEECKIERICMKKCKRVGVFIDGILGGNFEKKIQQKNKKKI